MRVELTTEDGVPRKQAEEARDLIDILYRDAVPTATGGTLTVRPEPAGNGRRLYYAEASVVVDDQRLVGWATGESVLDATVQAAGKLNGRAAGTRVLVPGEWVEWARAARHGWRWKDDVLVRDLLFRDFDEGMRFLERVARDAEDHMRHPAMSIATNRVRLTIENPHHAGITVAELRLAAKVNAVVDGIAP